MTETVTTQGKKTVSDLFTITYGHSLEYNKFEEDLENGVNFVSRTAKNNGVSGKIKIPAGSNIRPVDGPVITVALGGSVLSTFLQLQPIVCGRDIHILSPKKTMSIEEMLFYCTAIEANKWKYNFGRQANRTLKYLILPDFMPENWKGNLGSLDFLSARNPQSEITVTLPDFKNWRPFKIIDLFEIVKQGDCTTPKPDRVAGKFPLVTSSKLTNGVTDYIANIPYKGKNPTLYPAGLLTFAKNGSVGETFVQPEPFFASLNVNILIPKMDYNYLTKIFIATSLKQATTKRYSFGYIVNYSRLAGLTINLPSKMVDGKCVVDEQSIVLFMKSLDWSSAF